MVAPVPSGATAGETVIASARSGEPDRYLAALLAPPSARPHLVALAAFASELARVPALVTREPAMAAIRLQWWRDAVTAGASTRTGSPIADAVLDAARQHGLPASLLIAVIDGREIEAAREPLDDEAALADYLWKTEGALFVLAARVMGPEGSGEPAARAARACGEAYGLARLLIGLPRALSQGWVPLPLSRVDASGTVPGRLLAGESDGATQTLLAGMHADAAQALVRSRPHVADLPRQLRPAFLPLALVEPYLRAFARPGRDALRNPTEVSPLTRVWRIAAAHWLGRL